MKRYISFFFILTFSVSSLLSQSIYGSDIGFDGYVGASNVGGSFGLGVKYGLKTSENLIVGPSVRLQRVWYNNLGIKNSANIYGGGVFAHYRYENALFAGVEFEMLRNPYNFVTFSDNNKMWAPTLFLGAGFSKEYNQKIRLNIGLFYDLINAENSPFRPGYFMKIKDSQTGQVTKILPFIYRLSVFIPLGNKELNEEEIDFDDE